MNIKSLNEKGYEIKVNHYRLMYGFDSFNGLPCVNEVPAPLIKRHGRQDAIMARGGRTTVEIRDKYGVTVGLGEAECSIKDNFCKRSGMELALVRALRQFEIV